MYASIPDALRALARKIGADANGRNEEEILNNIVVKLGGTPIRNHGVAGSIDAMTKVVDLDVMHNLTTPSVTPTTSAQSITPERPVDGYSSVSVSAVTSAIDANIVAGNIKKDVDILGVTGSYEGVHNATLNPDGTEFTYSSAELTSIIIPNGVTSIGISAFEDCANLSVITIPGSVTSIGSKAFYECTSLTAITIPSSVTSIGTDAFVDCTNLTTITINKAEGSITGAPWGAPNAAVIWNG